jgi:hypothetical protein
MFTDDDDKATADMLADAWQDAMEASERDDDDWQHGYVPADDAPTADDVFWYVIMTYLECAACQGTGIDTATCDGDWLTCSRCDGTGQ